MTTKPTTDTARRDWLEAKVAKWSRKANTFRGEIHIATFERFSIDLLRLNAEVKS